MNHNLSETFKCVRLPLAFLIVLQHYYTPDISGEFFESATGASYAIYSTVAEFLRICTTISVPIFFLMSGYLYFANIDLSNGGGIF